ncbi:hypothetical protein [Hydrogenovibrio marinus]|uniref:Uncharacterized protein n=1 Tax=Hydrogenovibrio marinus TaxID=28885 RepID=A0A066ZQV0_HYDMR|nr:hypothetical protein [Hydrogenovibrio marinus]KDN94639.1 hypothetical protein EI16_12115 [Hydrogenovibrio marinus]
MFKPVKTGRQLEYTIQPFAGLFLYSGFGSGAFFSSDGNKCWTDVTEAREMAKNEGIEFVYLDSFAIPPKHMMV